jgi:polyisoprenoid-binding protein YceI
VNRTILFVSILVILVVACSTPTPTVAPTVAPTIAPTAAPKPTDPPKPTTAPTTAASNELIRITLKEGSSEARFRVREQLAGVNLPSDAVGATKVISGTIIGKSDGTIVKEQSKFRVDMRTLVSDREQRDNFLRRNVIESNQYPYSEFVPTEVKGFPLPVKDGDIAFQLIGDLTIRNVTKPVTWDVAGKVTGNTGKGTAKTSFNFAYFNLTQPRVPLVLSIEDNIRLEVDVTVTRE